jgi:hypothetical protein
MRHYSYFNKHVLNPINRDGYVGAGATAMMALRDKARAPPTPRSIGVMSRVDKRKKGRSTKRSTKPTQTNSRRVATVKARIAAARRGALDPWLESESACIS